MEWGKKLSRSDARQETEGSFMPFRFTNENCPGDYTVWFREEFFRELEWKDAPGKQFPTEEADLAVSVNIMGTDLGLKTMKVTHAEERHKNHGAPPTHLDFDEETKQYLQEHDMAVKDISFSKNDLTGDFKIVIQDKIS
jgi:hypothetical protein